MPKARQRLSWEFKNPINIHKLRGFDPVFLLQSNQKGGKNLLAIGSRKKLAKPTFDALNDLIEKEGDWAFGYIAYDAKNQLENLKSENPYSHQNPDLEFHIPKLVIEWSGSTGSIQFHEDDYTELDVRTLLDKMCTPGNTPEEELPKIEFQSKISRNEYLKKIKLLQEEIHYGNIYEANFCQEFTSSISIDPYAVFQRLVDISPTPFSCFVNCNEFFLMSASPERYIKKEGQRLVSEPIKGTTKRHSNPQIDHQLKQQLLNSEKDRSENVMIVDLVRNDLSRVAKSKSVQVEELFGLYSFPQVHQMISRVSAELDTSYTLVDVLKASFPMGSMTGAPKIKAMQLIEEHESFKRGIYSGTVGYFTPSGDFDFNVVIRSLLYSGDTSMLTFAVGGAITNGSNPEDEYEESLLKAKAIFEVFS